MRAPAIGQGARIGLLGFARKGRGSVTLESALMVAALLAVFAALMEIVHARWTADRMGRAARAAAEAIALDGAADACAAIRRELHLEEGSECGDDMKITVDMQVGPNGLPATLDAEAKDDTGELVLVRIEWTRGLWPSGTIGEDEKDEDDWLSDLTRMVSVGIARRESVE